MERSLEVPPASLFTQRGGARIGRSSWWSANATWPLAHLQVTSESLELKMLGSTYRFAKSEIERIRVYRGMFSRGVQVLHAKAGYPPFVVFWTFNLAEVVSHLQAGRFPVDR